MWEFYSPLIPWKAISTKETLTERKEVWKFESKLILKESRRKIKVKLVDSPWKKLFLRVFSEIWPIIFLNGSVFVWTWHQEEHELGEVRKHVVRLRWNARYKRYKIEGGEKTWKMPRSILLISGMETRYLPSLMAMEVVYSIFRNWSQYLC